MIGQPCRAGKTSGGLLRLELENQHHGSRRQRHHKSSWENRIRLPFSSFVFRALPLKHFPDGYAFVAKQVKQLQNSYNSTQNSNNVLPLNAVNH